MRDDGEPEARHILHHLQLGVDELLRAWRGERPRVVACYRRALEVNEIFRIDRIENIRAVAGYGFGKRTSYLRPRSGADECVNLEVCSTSLSHGKASQKGNGTHSGRERVSGYPAQ